MVSGQIKGSTKQDAVQDANHVVQVRNVKWNEILDICNHRPKQIQGIENVQEAAGQRRPPWSAAVGNQRESKQAINPARDPNDPAVHEGEENEITGRQRADEDARHILPTLRPLELKAKQKQEQ